MKFVLDSSVAFKGVVPELHSDKVLRLRSGFLAAVYKLLSPDVFPGEVGHALTRAERQGRITLGEALRLWTDIMTSSPRLVVSLPLTHRAIAISSQTRVGVFDCMYIALADQEGCPFVTADDRIIKNLQPHFPFIVPLSSLP